MANRISRSPIKPGPTIYMLIDGWFPFMGGGQIHVKNLSQTLSRKFNYQLKIFYPPHTDIISRLVWSISVMASVLIEAQKNRPRIIHSHGFIAGLPAKIISHILHIPCVHTVHGSHLMDQNIKGPKYWLEKFLLTQINYSAQISVSASFKKYHNVNTNFHIIRNGVDVNSFDRVKVKKYPCPTIVCIARNHPHKGLKYLSEAFKLAKQKVPHLQLKIYTSGNLFGRRLITAFKQAHLFVLPSLAEGQPITILEAWAAKLPVIVTKVGDNPYLIKSSVNGYLVDPANAKKLADLIIKCFKHPVKMKQMGQAGHRLVTDHYTWDHVATTTHQVYQDLLK